MPKEFITIYQRPASVLPDKIDFEYKFILKIGSFSNTIIFPEYFTFHEGIHSLDDLMNVSADSLKKLTGMSAEAGMKDTMIAGGTIVLSNEGRLYNAAPVIYNGAVLGYYFKRSLFLNESHYLSRGGEGLVVEHPATKDKWGFLICADVKSPEYFMAYNGVKYVAIPVASPFLPGDTDEARLRRDLSIFRDGAQKSGAVLFKCCLTGKTGTIDNRISPVNSGKVQGRSLIATPDKILTRAPNIYWRGALSYSTKNAGVKTLDY